MKKYPEVLTESEIKRLLEQINTSTATGIRNKALIKLVLATGIRPKEIRELTWDNLDFKSKLLNLENRSLNLTDEMIDILQNWRIVQEEYVRDSDYVFTTVQRLKNGNRDKTGYYTKPGNKLMGNYLRAFLSRYRKKAGINKKISPMNLRHSFAKGFYRKTQSLKKLRRVLGITNLADVRKYQELVEKEYRDLIDRLL